MERGKKNLSANDAHHREESGQGREQKAIIHFPGQGETKDPAQSVKTYFSSLPVDDAYNDLQSPGFPSKQGWPRQMKEI